MITRHYTAGELIVRDRYSYCGTILNGKNLGKSGSGFVDTLQMGETN